MLRSRPWHRWVVAGAFLVGVFYLFPALTFKPTTSTALADTRFLTPAPLSNLPFLKELLRDNGLGPEVEFASRHLKYRRNAESRPPLSKVPNKLFPNPPTTINIETATTLPQLLPPVTLAVENSPRPNEVDASALIFGVSTTYSRFNDDAAGPLREWTRWLTDGNGSSNGAALVLCLHEATDDQILLAQTKLGDVGIHATVQHSDGSLDMPGRYFSLITALYNHPSRERRSYFGLIDDDTFFPSIAALLSMLSEYDPSKPYYIGAFTERVDWMMDHKVPMAYGGAGVFFTAPVVKTLDDLTPTCLKKDPKSGLYLEWGEQGDLLLYNCLHNHTEVVLTNVPQLHQMDQFGDPSGLYESGELPLSLHHYKSWHRLAPEKVHVVTDACGLNCIFQRFQFADDWVLSNGYTISAYPRGIDFDITKMEGTFDNGLANNGVEDVSLSYSFGPLRKNLAGTGRKLSWSLLDARSDDYGRVTQVYVKRKDDERWLAKDESKPQLDSIIVLVWEL
ncbi:hypothetical protein BP5796_11497 [Coleophoma crateriformis]|uniref:Glycosyltransferase family 31 protein n=1 Tax=Coleophoma crateriformis TaxID=565419 RepID=A0A3D8QIJ2_9HELO|nr:hypothetical protein BP5796_11497 [Coleophoma crateriformis]